MTPGRTSLALAAVLALATTIADRASADSLESRRADARAITRGQGRNEALERTCGLGAADLPVIRERIADIRAHGRPTSDAGYVALGEFAEAAGGTGPADPRDLLPGILSFPSDRFSVTHATIAERYCLLRSLERMGTAEALVAALPLVAFDIRALRWQARHLVRRNGRRSVAMLIRARGLTNPEVTLWSGWGLVELGIRDSGGSVQEQSEESLIAVLRAYPAANHLGGMPVVASFVDDDRATIRAAARAGLGDYGENAVWEIRRLHQTRLGRDPGAGSAAALLRSLSQELDRRREAPLRTRATQALAATDDATARRLADELIADAPTAPATRELAPMLVRQATDDAQAGRFDAARARLAIARRLGANGDDARALDAALERHRLEARGIVEEVTETIELPTTEHSALARRRELATFGFVVALLLLAGPSLALVLRRFGRVGASHARDRATALVAWWRDGGREQTITHGRALLDRAIALANRARRALAQRPQTPVPAARVEVPVVDLPRTPDPVVARAPTPEPIVAVAPTPEPIVASAPPPEPRPVPVVTSETAPESAPAPSARRRDRPTRKAAASVDLFTSTPPKRRESA